LSKIYKSSRVILDDSTFILSAKVEHLAQEIQSEIDENEPTREEVKTADQILASAQEEGNEIVLNAEKEAKSREFLATKSVEKIIADAYDQARGIMEQARKEGYQEGFDKSITESKSTADQIIEEALQLKNEWLKEKEKLLKNTEYEMINLVLEVARTIIDKEIDEDQDLIENLIRSGIERVINTEKLVLRVSNSDYHHVLSIKSMILAMSDRVDEIEIKADDLLLKGSCVIDSDAGHIDSGVWTQFEEIKSIFENILKSE